MVSNRAESEPKGLQQPTQLSPHGRRQQQIRHRRFDRPVAPILSKNTWSRQPEEVPRLPRLLASRHVALEIPRLRSRGNIESGPQSVPRILGGAGLGSAAAEATPILARLSLQPGKLSYSHGSMLIPIAGAFGLPAMCNVSLATNHSGQRRSIREWGSRTCARYSGERT